MLERFTEAARAVVLGAREQARDLGHDYVGTEHVLLALLDAPGSIAHTVLSDAGLTTSRVRTDIERLVRGGALGADDAAALEAIGIDLAAVRAKVEESFGPGALVLPRERRRGLFRRRGNDQVGHLRFTPRSRKVLELAVREAISRHQPRIATEHLLLGLLREGQGLAARVIRDAGIDAHELRDRTVAALGQAA